MPITLTTPIQTSNGYVAVRRLTVDFPNDTTPAIAILIYGPCDAQGNPVAGNVSQVTLAAADVTAFFSTAGAWRPRALAALQSAAGAALAGQAT